MFDIPESVQRAKAGNSPGIRFRQQVPDRVVRILMVRLSGFVAWCIQHRELPDFHCVTVSRTAKIRALLMAARVRFAKEAGAFKAPGL
jgi:hypothetical protein